MLLAVDVGNSHTVFGVFKGEDLCADWRIATRRDSTADEIGVQLRALFTETGFRHDAVEGLIISSVVPDMNGVLAEAGRRYLGQDPLFVGPGMKTGMPIEYENPHEVGADRIVNAVAAVALYGSPVIVLDFGTATTFDVVGPTGAYLGGTIAPGLAVSAEALVERAARLHRVDIKRPTHVIGRNTEESMQSGLYFGYSGLVEGLVSRIRNELGCDARVVATGGLCPGFEDELDFVHAVRLDLTLIGLRLLWERNKQ
jgi:type III pantothenate kinase